MELLWSLYTNRSTWKTVYRPFGSIDFHATAGIPAFRVQRVNPGGNLNHILLGLSCLRFYCALQQLPGDAVIHGDVFIPQLLPLLYSLQDWLLGTCDVTDGRPLIFINLSLSVSDLQNSLKALYFKIV